MMLKPIREPERLDALGQFMIVFRLRDEKPGSRKRVEHASSFKSLRDASVGMLRIIESRGYSAAECLGARVIDKERWPYVVA